MASKVVSIQGGDVYDLRAPLCQQNNQAAVVNISACVSATDRSFKISAVIWCGNNSVECQGITMKAWQMTV